MFFAINRRRWLFQSTELRLRRVAFIGMFFAINRRRWLFQSGELRLRRVAFIGMFFAINRQRWLLRSPSVCSFRRSREGISGPEKHEKVLEKLATSDKATIVIERQPDGKMRVTSGSWDGEKVILPDQVLEVRRRRPGAVARGARKPNEWDPPDRALRSVWPGTERKRLCGQRSH
jgi:hypothetical protein